MLSNNVVKKNVSSLCAKNRNPMVTAAGKLHQRVMPSYFSTAATQTKGDKELVDFLKEEVEAETKAQKFQQLPALEGFKVEQTGADITLTREVNGENITVKLNVNHTVQTEFPQEEKDPKQDKEEMAVMKSKPSFTVELSRGEKRLGFSCSYVQKYEEEPHSSEGEAFSDVFNIDELAVYEGDWKDTTYAVSGEIMDGYLYDLLMNMLEERGISNEFAEKLSDYATAYEHKQYIGILERLKEFAEAK